MKPDALSINTAHALTNNAPGTHRAIPTTRHNMPCADQNSAPRHVKSPFYYV